MTTFGDERSTLLRYLHQYRATLERKCADLNADQLARRSVPPSTLSLLGLVRHLAEVERSWFHRLSGEDAAGIWWCDEDLDGDFDGAIGDDEEVRQAFVIWREEMANADTFIESHPDLGFETTTPSGRHVQLRDVLVHLVEEYARHCGHADLLRESIDGRTGG